MSCHRKWAYNNGDDNDRPSAGGRSFFAKYESIRGAGSCSPVHPRNSTRQNQSTNDLFPKGVVPLRSEIKEKNQSGVCRNHGDDNRSQDMTDIICTSVIDDG